MDALKAFIDSPAGTALVAMIGVAFADFFTGSFAALRDGTFQLDALAAFVRKHIWGRVAPIGLLLGLGYAGGEGIGQLFLASAIAAATAYAAETAASIVGNLNPPKDPEIVGLDEVVVEVNPVPKD